MNEPRITVIIPTRERPDTLYHSLRTVVAQRYENLSILVSDNFSQDNTREVVSSFSDPRIRYVNTGKRVGMSQNWEFALRHVTDGWVGFLGDDDGLLPGGIERVARVIAETGVKALASRWKFYFWPGSTENGNRLTIPLATGYEVRDSRVWLKRLMDGWESDYFLLPHLYTGGFAEVSAVNAARHPDGTFFRSMIPDVYSAIALAATTERYALIHEPVAVMGVSSHSNGASVFGVGKSRAAAEKFYSEENLPFHPRLGTERNRSVRVCLYESYLQAEHLHGNAIPVDMAAQLSLALAQATPDYYPELLGYCRGVASKNGLRADEVGRGTRYKALVLWEFLRTLREELDSVTVDASTYHVTDVYGAALLSRALHQFQQANRHWKARKMARLAGTILSLAFRKFLSVR